MNIVSSTKIYPSNIFFGITSMIWDDISILGIYFWNKKEPFIDLSKNDALVTDW